MKTELLQWLIHQPALFAGGFVLGVYAAARYPASVQPQNMLLLAGAALVVLGGKVSWDQMRSKP